MRHRDYQGIVAVILAIGLVLDGLALLTNFGGGSPTKLDSTLLATVFGGLIASLGQFLSGNRREQNANDEAEAASQGQGTHDDNAA